MQKVSYFTSHGYLLVLIDVVVLNEDDDGWVIGLSTVSGKRGLIPANFVRVLDGSIDIGTL